MTVNKVKINGKVYRGNVTIVNGQVIEGNSSKSGPSKKIDEVKKESSAGIYAITVNSSVNVKVAKSSTDDIEIHLHGKTLEGNEPNLKLQRFGDELRIFVESTSETNFSSINVINGSSISISNMVTNCSDDLLLEVKLPVKTFKKLHVISTNGEIEVNKDVKVDILKIDTKNGNIDVEAIFKNLIAETKNGNIDIDSRAVSDIELSVETKNGNVHASISNIGISNVRVDTKNGFCRNNPRLKGVYTASGYITTKNGNIKFH